MKTEHRKDDRTDVKTSGKRVRKDHATTPDSATSLEKERLDDDAVERAVTVDPESADPKSVLPCPPIPPNKQRKAREGMVSEDEDRPAPNPRKKAAK